MNWRLAAFLAWRSLRRHRVVALATVLGVAIGMTVVGAILVVDRNSVESRIRGEISDRSVALGPDGSESAAEPARILRVRFERGEEREPSTNSFPSQEGKAASGLSADAPPLRRGEEDYQAMRLAVRLASVLAFGVAAVIVFYSMRFSVASRSRELSLLLCVGEERRNLGLSLLAEAFLLGALGTLVGLLLAFPTAGALLDAGISTTGRVPAASPVVPWIELAGMAFLSLAVALLAVAGPVRALYQLQIVEVLQPRFAAPGDERQSFQTRGFAWLLPPLMAAAWLALRPFLKTWLSVVEFFVLEALFAGLLALAVLWWMPPMLRGAVRLAETVLRPLLPLETLLVGRRLRLTSRKLLFTLVGVTLVFSLVTALHDITRALKHEIAGWAEEALAPYAFLKRDALANLDGDRLAPIEGAEDLWVFRLSRKVAGELPLRLAYSGDINPYLAARGRPLLGPGRVLVSRTLAARFDSARAIPCSPARWSSLSATMPSSEHAPGMSRYRHATGMTQSGEQTHREVRVACATKDGCSRGNDTSPPRRDSGRHELTIAPMTTLANTAACRTMLPVLYNHRQA